jgi:mono/diheme cytochrome c family protein
VAAHASENPFSQPAREVLVQACGSCHRPGLSTTKPGALLVFNLEEEPWDGRLSEDQLRQLEQRTAGPDTLNDDDRATIRAYVSHALGAL